MPIPRDYMEPVPRPQGASVDSPHAIPWPLCNRHLRCDCKEVAMYRVRITMIGGGGHEMHGYLYLCPAHYAEFMRDETPLSCP